MLTNGNYVVSSPLVNTSTTDVGAVTWGSGTAGVKGPVSNVSLLGMTTGDMASLVAGSTAFRITPLENGHFVVWMAGFDDLGVQDVGAVTWVNGNTGLIGPVGVGNSLVGSRSNDMQFSELIELPNGNYLIFNPVWDNGASAPTAGAITWVNGASGISGVVSASNSLVGGRGNDQIGSGGITFLSNGNYLVSSPNVDNGFTGTNAGAVTWGSAAAGVRGVVSASNSLIGASAGDQVGENSPMLLSDGNYLVITPLWDNGPAVDAGAVTWGSASAGVSGTIGPGVSLVGSSANDQVGYHLVTELADGNYLVLTPTWDNGATADAGAVTFGAAGIGVRGEIASSNSLVGSTAHDLVGYDGIVELANGNYLVRSHWWDNGSAINVGAVTFGSGVAGVAGVVSAANSLVGSTAGDTVGKAVTALANGNFLVHSRDWDNAGVVDAGALTWGSGITGVAGVVSAANSLVGTDANDAVGAALVTQLSNGNLVVISTLWHNLTGAATWINGSTGIQGELSALNSLVGSTPNDRVGLSGVHELANGNYIVKNWHWDNGAAVDAGAVTWGNGTTGVAGVIRAANSLVGSASFDGIGSGGHTLLPDGNYLLMSPFWDNGAAVNAGALTWGSGTAGVAGVLSAANSLVGGTAEDRVGSTSVMLLSNGNYIAKTIGWDNGTAVDAGALTFGVSATGVRGVVSAGNSLVGSSVGDQMGSAQIVELADGNFYVVNGNWDNGAIVNAGTLTWGGGTTGISGEVSALNSVVGETANIGFSFIVRLDNDRGVLLVSRAQDGSGHVNVVSQSTGLSNGAPTALNLTGAVTSLPESTSTVSPVPLGTLEVVDDYLGSNVFTLSGPDAAAFEIVGSVLQLRAGVVLDFETKPVFQVTISVDDAAVGSDPDASLEFTLSVTDSPEFDVGPVSDISSQADSVSELAASGTLAGIQAFAVDADPSHHVVTYELLDDAGGRFVIDAVTGIVTVASGAVFNYEAETSHAIVVAAHSEDGSQSQQSFVIQVLDEDEFNVGPITDFDAASNSVPENSPAGTPVGFTARATDADGTNSEVTYALAQTHGGRFAIDAVSGVVTVGGVLLDREEQASWPLTVVATSEDGSVSVLDFTVSVSDVNEFRVEEVLDLNPAANSIPENAANGTPVGITGFGVDADATNNGVTYSLFNTRGGRFTIHPTTGVVTVANGALIDREANASWPITILATSQDGSIGVQEFTITIQDVDEYNVLQVFDLDAAPNSVPENAASGTSVGITGFGIDLDATNNSVTYALSSTAGGRFRIDAATGVVSVVNGALLDFEAQASHPITVVATSSDGSSASRTFTVDVTNVEDAPRLTLSKTTVPENQSSGTVVGTLGVVDAVVTSPVFRLVSGTGGTDNSKFTISGNQLKTRSKFNFETKSSYSIRVQVQAAGGFLLTQVFTIQVTNVNEKPTRLTISSTKIAENNAVGTLSAVDPDTGDAFNYTLVPGSGSTDNARFTIVGNQLLALERFDYERKRSYTIRVQVTDAAGLSYEKALRISILNGPA